MKVTHRSEIKPVKDNNAWSITYNAEVGIQISGRYYPKINFSMEIRDKSLRSFNIKSEKKEWKVDYIK